jgi:hypothetical protein
MEKKREFSPMKGEMPNPNEIFCRDCTFRDKTTIDLGSGEIPVGVTKAYCDIFVLPNCKPNDILFQQAPCDYWVKDEDVI